MMVAGAYRVSHSSRTSLLLVRECCKGDEASQWRKPKFDPSHAQTPQAIVIQIGTGDYVVDPYTCATVRHDPPRRFASAHA